MVTLNELKKLKDERDMLLEIKKIQSEKLKLMREIKSLKSPRVTLIKKILLKRGKETLTFLERATRPPRRRIVRRIVRRRRR